ncbi:MAG: TetR/AcrR family transcriptional regulator, partial [Clostridia bacterium]|nr:TetR/AcrR family transcriptional regulator [Clostridia bacterium]
MKENQRVALSKRLLKEALVRLLEKKKLDNITVFELCAEAGINRATFYRHYGIPKDLLLDLELDMVEEIRSVLKKPFQKENVLENIETIFTY